MGNLELILSTLVLIFIFGGCIGVFICNKLEAIVDLLQHQTRLLQKLKSEASGQHSKEG